MEVRETHRVDSSGPDADGEYDYHYEYDLLEFVFGSRVARVRKYSDEPTLAHLLDVRNELTPHAPPEAFVTAPEAPAVIDELRRRGFTEFRTFTRNGYKNVDPSKLTDRSPLGMLRLWTQHPALFVARGIAAIIVIFLVFIALRGLFSQ
jgi:hypothetical protein